MKLRFLALILLIAVIGRPVLAPQQAKPQPLTKDQVLHLVAGGVPSERIAALVEQRGIDFLADEEYLNSLRQAGADDAVLAAVRAASARAMAEVLVVTSPNAEVFLDGESQGHATAQGELTMKAKLGAHTLKVSLAGKKDFQQALTLAGVQAAKVEAQLVDAPGSIRLRTLAGASITLDGASRGSADANGELVLGEVSPGAHELQVSAPRKKDFLQRVTVVAGQETPVEAQLVEALGSIRLRTLAGAAISLDGASRGSVDANGELVLGEVSPGTHELQVSAPRKKDFLQRVTVTAGEETRVEAPLRDASPAPPQVRENPKDGLKYVWIPPGSFEMGCSPGDNVCFADEKPSHHVTITKGFWLGQTEVTVEAYQRFTEATGRHMPRAPKFNSDWANNRLPIVNVNWNGARDYCKWAGGRLPTEAEWEYAARGGGAQARYGDLEGIAWSNENSHGQAHEVAQKRPNPFGLYDMLGNVAEWVNDWYDKNYYQTSPSQDPSGPASGSTNVLRGGSWSSSAWDLRVSGRYGNNPDLMNDYVGIRCGGEVFPP